MGWQAWVYLYPPTLLPVLWGFSQVYERVASSLPEGILLLDLCANHSLPLMNTMFEHKGVHKCTWHQDTLGCRAMIDFVVISSVLQPYILDTGEELSTDHHLVVSWIRWWGRMLNRPDRPIRIVWVHRDCLAEAPVSKIVNSHIRQSFDCIPVEAGGIELNHSRGSKTSSFHIERS